MAMMKKDMGMGGMCKCPHHKWFGWIFLIAGVLYLLSDLNWVTWWGLNWWTVAFILIGLSAFCKCCGKSMC